MFCLLEELALEMCLFRPLYLSHHLFILLWTPGYLFYTWVTIQYTFLIYFFGYWQCFHLVTVSPLTQMRYFLTALLRYN